MALYVFCALCHTVALGVYTCHTVCLTSLSVLLFCHDTEAQSIAQSSGKGQAFLNALAKYPSVLKCLYRQCSDSQFNFQDAPFGTSCCKSESAKKAGQCGCIA